MLVFFSSRRTTNKQKRMHKKVAANKSDLMFSAIRFELFLPVAFRLITRKCFYTSIYFALIAGAVKPANITRTRAAFQVTHLFCHLEIRPNFIHYVYQYHYSHFFHILLWVNFSFPWLADIWLISVSIYVVWNSETFATKVSVPR